MFRLVGYEVMKREVEVETVPVRQGQRPEYQEAGLLGLAGWGALRPSDCMGDGGLSAQGTSVLKQPRLCLSLRTLSLCSHGALVGKQDRSGPKQSVAPDRTDPKWWTRTIESRQKMEKLRMEEPSQRRDLHKQALSMNRVQKASIVSADLNRSKVWGQ